MVVLELQHLDQFLNEAVVLYVKVILDGQRVRVDDGRERLQTCLYALQTLAVVRKVVRQSETGEKQHLFILGHVVGGDKLFHEFGQSAVSDLIHVLDVNDVQNDGRFDVRFARLQCGRLVVFAGRRAGRLVFVKLKVKRGRTRRVAGSFQILTAFGQAETVFIASPTLFVRKERAISGQWLAITILGSIRRGRTILTSAK